MNSLWMWGGWPLGSADLCQTEVNRSGTLCNLLNSKPLSEGEGTGQYSKLKFAYFQVKLFWLHVYEVFGYVYLCTGGSVHQDSVRALGARPVTDFLSRLLLFVCP